MTNDHESAVDADLLANTGYGLDDLGSDLSWSAAYHIVEHLGLDSALASDLNKDIPLWNSTLKTNTILADIFDVLASIRYILARMAGANASKPHPYTRPKKDNKNHYGKGAVKVNEIKDFIKRFKKKS